MNQCCSHESALYHTALIRNQRCIQQHRYQFSKVCLPNHFSLEAMSAVRYWYIANLELALYQTALIHEFLPSNMNISANSKLNSKNILGCESGAHKGSIHEKKPELKNIVLLSF
jgi:hypothetical protein